MLTSILVTKRLVDLIKLLMSNTNIYIVASQRALPSLFSRSTDSCCRYTKEVLSSQLDWIIFK